MRWFLNRTGQFEGPLEESFLIEMIERGEVPSTAKICPEGSSGWRPLLEHPHLASALGRQDSASGVAPTLAMPSVDDAHMRGMLGSLSGVSDSATAPRSSSPPVAFSSSAPPPAMTFSSSPPPPTLTPTPPPGPSSTPPPMLTPTPSPSSFPPPGSPKRSAGLMAGGGCGLLIAMTLCAGSGGLVFWGSDSGSFSDRTRHVSDIVSRVAIDGQHDDASEWACAVGEDLMSTSPETRAAMAPLGSDPEIALTVVSLVSIRERQVIRGLALVFPDGRVRYSNVRTAETLAFRGPVEGWSTGRERDQEMMEGATQLIALLADDACEIEWVTTADLEGLPTDLIGDVMRGVSIPSLREACAAVRTTDGWRYQIEEVSVVLRGNEHTALLHTAMAQPPGTSVCLGPIHARMTEAPSGES